MSVAPNTTPHISQMTGAQAVVAALVRHGITAGFGIPSIHNIAVYEALRQTPEFHHWVVRHEQAAGYAADGFYRRSGQIAAIFASTGPGNLFTLVPLLESLQTNIPVLLIGTNIASSCSPRPAARCMKLRSNLEIVRPLTRFARRVARPDDLLATVAEAVNCSSRSVAGPGIHRGSSRFFSRAGNREILLRSQIRRQNRICCSGCKKSKMRSDKLRAAETSNSCWARAQGVAAGGPTIC